MPFRRVMWTRRKARDQVDDITDIVFGKMDEHGTLTDERHIARANVGACPHVILVPDHYRADGTCKCDDESAREMRAWGYVWRNGQWRAPASPIFRTWRDRIDAGTFTKAQCGAWARVVYALTDGNAPRGHKTNLTADEAVELADMLGRRGGVFLTREHTAQGLAWMRSRKVAPKFPAWCLESFSHFTFQGEGYDIDTRGYWAYYVPVWRVHSVEGWTLDYCAAAWQSGDDVGPRIIRRTP